MNDKEFAERFKDHPAMCRDEVHEQILKELKTITALSESMTRKLEHRKNHKFELWSGTLIDLHWSSDHVMKHTLALRELLERNQNHHVSKGFEKRLLKVKQC